MTRFLLSAMLVVAAADYAPLYRSLADGRYEEFRRQAVEALGRERSIGRKLEILRVLSANKKKFYAPGDFMGRALPFATERCQPVDGQQTVCSSEQGFDFALARETGRQLFVIKAKGQVLQSTMVRSRTLLAAPDLAFGRTLHLIFPVKKSGEFFLLIRELEKSHGLPQPVRQTMHVFRLRGSSVCKILEADVSESDGKYDLIEEFVRSLGEQISCQNPPVQI